MNKTLALLLVVATFLVVAITARNYAVVVAGSNGYYNYRHQSDIAHHYQILRERGYQEDDIITFMFDDLAQNKQNPYPGSTYNKPSPAGTEGLNYYNLDGRKIKIDYSGKDVTPANFLAVLVGNSTGIGPTLNTGLEDNILVTFSDHGAPGLLAFPSEELYVKEWQNALDQMVYNKRFGKMLIELEACESGSMGKNVLSPNSNIVILTASDEHQSSWGKYCGSEATVNGKSIGSCLADEFAFALGDYIENFGISGTVGDQHEYLVTTVSKSPVQYFGEPEYKAWKLADFFAQVDFTEEQNQALLSRNGLSARRQQPVNEIQVNSRDMTVAYLFDRYLDESESLSHTERIVAGRELLAELNNRLNADARFTRIAEKALAASGANLNAAHAAELHSINSPVAAIDCGRCCEKAIRFLGRSKSCPLDDYNLKYIKTLHNICTLSAKDMTIEVMTALNSECPL